MDDNVIKLGANGVDVATRRNVEVFEARVLEAIREAIAKEVPQGFIVAILHGAAHYQTARMLNDNDTPRW